MNSITLTHHRDFPFTPISYWVGAQFYGWRPRLSASGQWMRPQWCQTPFTEQRRLWCRMEVSFRGIDLLFAIPQELDQFLDVMGQKNLPSGPRLVRGFRVGRPNRHWLSRLPATAKPWKFRKALCEYLKRQKEVKAFREFYADQPVQLRFDDDYLGYYEAQRSAINLSKKKA